jgi:hypothetical protein
MQKRIHISDPAATRNISNCKKETGDNKSVVDCERTCDDKSVLRGLSGFEKTSRSSRKRYSSSPSLAGLLPPRS